MRGQWALRGFRKLKLVDFGKKGHTGDERRFFLVSNSVTTSRRFVAPEGVDISRESVSRIPHSKSTSIIGASAPGVEFNVRKWRKEGAKEPGSDAPIF